MKFILGLIAGMVLMNSVLSNFTIPREDVRKRVAYAYNLAVSECNEKTGLIRLNQNDVEAILLERYEND